MKDDQPKQAFYQAHLFFCVNRRPDDHPHGSCAVEGSADLFDFMKERAHEMGLEGVHINSAGCLGRCDKRPAVVIYPDEVWYTCANRDDAEQILTGHLRDGKPVEHLMVGPDD